MSNIKLKMRVNTANDGFECHIGDLYLAFFNQAVPHDIGALNLVPDEFTCRFAAFFHNGLAICLTSSRHHRVQMCR